ncbi:MAG: hypothetical protein MUP03_06565 [Anaerolineales bacterium]|jgi:hypothetical protein|nr:hypothetical protein [Anaerolineales bacterium]
MKTSKLIDTVFKSLAVAMSVTVVVLSILKTAEPGTLILFLGFGLFCLTITSLSKE